MCASNFLQTKIRQAKMLQTKMLQAKMLQAKMFQAQSRKNVNPIPVGLVQFLVATGGGMLNVSMPNAFALKDLATRMVAALTKQNFRLSRYARQALSWHGSQANVQFVMTLHAWMVLEHGVQVTSVALMDQHVLQPLSTTLEVVQQRSHPIAHFCRCQVHALLKLWCTALMVP